MNTPNSRTVSQRSKNSLMQEQPPSFESPLVKFETQTAGDGGYLLQLKSQRCNRLLQNLGYDHTIPILQDMGFNLRILDIMYFLLEEIQGYRERENKMMIHRRKTGEFLLEKEEIMARVEKQQRVLSAEREALIFEKANLERTYKEMIAKVVAEKEEIGHKLKKIQAREKTIEAQFRKKEKQISSLQEKIKKNQEKNSSKAQFQVIERPENEWKTVGNQKQGIFQYKKLAVEKLALTLDKITEENNLLKEIISNVIMQLNTVFMVLNEKLFDTSLLTEIQPFETIKPDVFRSYMQQKPALLSQIHYSIRKIQLVFTKMVSGIEKEPKICPNCMTYKQKDAFNTPGTATSSGSKQSPSNLAVPLLENYKQIIKSQNQLLTKMKLKSQNFLQEGDELKMEEEEYCQALQKCELDKIQEYLKQQIQYVDDKGYNLMKTKEKLSRSLERTIGIRDRIKMVAQGS